MIRALLSAGLRSVAIVCCVAATGTGCGRPDAVTAAGTDVDSLIVSLDDVRRIANLQDLNQYSHGDADRPGNEDADAPEPCRSVYDQQVAFGSDWRQFRTVTYNALVSASHGAPAKMYVVTQAVGIYPDGSAARAAFDRLAPALTACSELRRKYYDFTVSHQDPATVALDYPEGQSKVVYRVKSTALIDIVVQGFSQSERIAATTLQTIADRIA